jgi:MinD-like ATPase involved in chromosome partitioning or flagellar assembly
MDARLDGEVITFYSYKGGVGRSMCLANVAASLAQSGRRVLAVDCDFEAPGLHRYFRAPPDMANRKGAIEFFRDLGQALHDVEKTDDSDPQRFTPVIQQLLDSANYGYPVSIKNPNEDGNARAELTLLPAGLFDAGYADQVRAFDWGGLYGRFPSLFRVLAAEWGRRYDYVLIDSRTGLTDVGSICTVMLPEKLVLVFTPNEQSLNGALEVGRQAVEHRARQRQDLRPLPLFPLLSRIENAELKLQGEWTEKAQHRFEAIFREIYDLDNCDLSRYFAAVQVPHRSYYSYGERIATEEQKVLELNSLAAAFRQVTTALTSDNAITAAQQLTAALLPSADALEQRRQLVEAQERTKVLEKALEDKSLAAAELERKASERPAGRPKLVAYALAGLVLVLLSGLGVAILRRPKPLPTREPQISRTAAPNSPTADEGAAQRIADILAVARETEDPGLAAGLLLELKGRPEPPGGLAVARAVAARRLPISVWPSSKMGTLCGPKRIVFFQDGLLAPLHDGFRGPELQPVDGRGQPQQLIAPKTVGPWIGPNNSLFCSEDGNTVVAGAFGPTHSSLAWRGTEATVLGSGYVFHDFVFGPRGETAVEFVRSPKKGSRFIRFGSKAVNLPGANAVLPIDDNRVMLTDGRVVSLRDGQRGALLAQQHMNVLNFSAASQQVIAFGRDGVWLWNTDDIHAGRFAGRQVFSEPVHLAVLSVTGIALIREETSPKELSLLPRDQDGHFGTRQSIELPKVPKGVKRKSVQLSFGDNGKYIVAGGYDSGTSVYSIATRRWHYLPGLGGDTSTLAPLFMVDRAIWPLDEPGPIPDTWDAILDNIGRRTTVCLTPEQRAQYLGETRTVARDRTAACERRFGRTPPEDDETAPPKP